MQAIDHGQVGEAEAAIVATAHGAVSQDVLGASQVHWARRTARLAMERSMLPRYLGSGAISESLGNGPSAFLYQGIQ